MSQVDENGIVLVPTIISGISGSLAFMPADISTSSYALTGSDLEDFIRETASFTLDANDNELKITIPATHSNLTEDIIPLYITASGINPRVGVGVTSPLTTFDFKDVEDATTGTELLLRNSRISEGAQVGDSAGKLFFTIDSSSFTDVKTEGAIATIETQVDSVDYTGVTGELIFSVAQGKSVAPVNKLKINPTLTQITGSLDVSTDVSGSGLYFSSSGQSFINRLAVGTQTILSPSSNNRFLVGGDAIFKGDVDLGDQASDIINIHGIVEITGSVTSSADISSSGAVTTSGIVSSGDIHLSTNNTQITQVLSAGATRDLIGFDGDNNAVVGNSTANKIKLVGDVTASANISASGDLFFRSRTIAYSTTTDAYSGDVVSFGSGPNGNDGNINAGELYYLDSSQNWELADADASSTATNMLGIAVADNTATFLVKGIIQNTAYGGFTTGVPLYVSTTAGDITGTAPNDTGDIVRVVGYSINGGSRIIYFNPSNDHIVHA